MHSYAKSDIRKGYTQGRVGAHRDSGAEFAHGRASTEGSGKIGHDISSKMVRSHTDGGMERAAGRPNQRASMGRSKYNDPTQKMAYRARQDGGMEGSHGKNKRQKGYSKAY